VVQSTDNLINGVWSDEAEYTNCPETGDVMTFSAEKQAAVRYYRVLVRQP
jgi:hypothetical protein